MRIRRIVPLGARACFAAAHAFAAQKTINLSLVTPISIAKDTDGRGKNLHQLYAVSLTMGETSDMLFLPV